MEMIHTVLFLPSRDEVFALDFELFDREMEELSIVLAVPGTWHLELVVEWSGMEDQFLDLTHGR